jgi:hypothetical protein
MGSGSKKKKGEIDMGNYTGTVPEQAAYYWCIHNGITISPSAKNTSEWFLVVSINGKSNISPVAYEKLAIWKQMFKYYVYYYIKYSGLSPPVKEEAKIIKKAEKAKPEKNNNNQTLF